MRVGSLLFTACGLLLGCTSTPASPPQPPPLATHIVFVTGDEEYRSEESMPMLAKILHRDYGFRVTVCYSLAKDGTIDPNNVKSISGLKALEDADLMVVFTRFRQLPDDQLKRIVEFAESGRPMVGFRTATHAFRYPKESPHAREMNNAWPTKVFGQKWITHHGHFGDGHMLLTDVTIVPEKKDHPILRGVKPFKAYSWLYHVQGKGHKLHGDSEPLLIGRALKSGAVKNGYPESNPVAWTKTHTGTSGKKARVFFATTAHPFDFKDASARKVVLNGILWALGMEDKIPKDGADAKIVGTYEPNNAGFGQKFKKGRRPEKIGGSKE